eukprot:gene31685-39140_t
MDKIEREPCPWRVVDDAGGAYVFGLVGGGLWHLGVGMKNAPAGKKKILGTQLCQVLQLAAFLLPEQDQKQLGETAGFGQSVEIQSTEKKEEPKKSSWW